MENNLEKTTGPGTFKPVNMPEPVAVKEDAFGLPLVLTEKSSQNVATTEGRQRTDDKKKRLPVKHQKVAAVEDRQRQSVKQQKVAAVEDRWRIDDEWWRAQPVSRLYYAVLLASGHRLVLYKDLVTGEWFKQAL